MSKSEPKADWPTPSFARPNTGYECARCPAVVTPKHGDKQAALVVAGSTIKVCGGCAEYLRDVIMGGS